MSFLYPLFLVGGAAIAAPIIFHMIRRVTRDKVSFSSLMFLKPSPPKLTKKSRIQHWFLLLLRCLVLLLMTLAFSRPFFSNQQSVELQADERVRHCLLLDRSASMRRNGVWEDALAKAEVWLSQWKQENYVTVFLFDESLQQVVSFADWSAINADVRVADVVNRLKGESPTWKSTSIDTALLESLNRMEEGAKEEEKDTEQQAWEMVVISDLQTGSRYESLRGQDWPKHAYVVFDGAKAKSPHNAGLQALQSAWQISEDGESVAPRVRVSNALESEKEQFQVAWQNASGPVPNTASLPMYVTPGQARITTAPEWPRTSGADRLVLSGDSESFDNTIWMAPFKPKRSRIVLLSPRQEATGDTELEYYLQRAFQSIPGHQVELIQPQSDAWDPMASLRSIDLWIITRPLTESVADGLRGKMAQGATVLMTIPSTAMQETLQTLWENPSLEISEASVSDFALFGKIDFQDPLFAPFADPRFSDFSKIHFWKYREIRNLDEDHTSMTIPARFDTGAPAILTHKAGLGRLVILTSSWMPQDSQLALSTKFVPWLYTILNLGRNYQELRTQYSIGEVVDLSSIPTVNKLLVRDPKGSESNIETEKLYRTTQEPGLYEIEADNDFKWTFAVNLDPNESRTSPLPVETLEGLGVPTRQPESAIEDTPESRQQSAEETRLLAAQEIEHQQKFWRWALAAVLGLILIESLVASFATRRQTAA
jgi:hypothetical protein